MATITISSVDFVSYASVQSADDFLIPDANFAVWDALTDDAKGSLLVRSTRIIDAQKYIEGASTQALRLAIDDFKTICILIANAISSGNTSISGSTVSEADQKRVKAGSVEIENFRSLYNLDSTKYEWQWTPEIYAILKNYLAGASLSFAASFGTSGEITIEDYSLGRN
jgi:hypothetical protein